MPLSPLYAGTVPSMELWVASTQNVTVFFFKKGAPPPPLFYTGTVCHRERVEGRGGGGGGITPDSPTYTDIVPSIGDKKGCGVFG